MLLSLFVLFVVFLLTAAFRVEIDVALDRDAIQPKLRVGVAGVSFSVPKRLLTKMSSTIRQRNLGNPEQLLRGMKLGLRLLDSFVQMVELFHLKAIIGTGDPFWSALSCGGVWSLLGPFFAGLSAGNRLESVPEISIQPDFDEVRLALYLHCIFRFRLGQIIINELKRMAFAWQART